MANEVTWRLEHEKIGRLLVHYAIPAVIGTMVNALYNIVDRIFIGQGVGPLAMAGLTLTFPILLFLQAFGMLVGAGAATRVSIHLGRKANDMAEKVLGNAFTLTFIITLVTVLPCMIWMEDLLFAFGGSEQTIPYAKDYLNIVVPGTILTSLSFGFNAVMRASGYPKKAMYTMLIGAVTNVILDPVFIFWLDMGIQGAAIATIVSMLLCTLFVMTHFVRKDSILRFHKGIFKLEKHVVWNILTIGVSPFAMQLAGSVVVVIQNYALKQYGGDLALGANGIITSVGMLQVMLIIGIAQGMQPIVGFNYGAGQHKRVQDTLWLVIITSTVIMGIGCLCSVLFPEIIARAFPGDVAAGYHHLDRHHGDRLLLQRGVSGTDRACLYERSGSVGGDGKWFADLFAGVCGRRFADCDQPVFPEYRDCLEGDVLEPKPSNVVPDTGDVAVLAFLGAGRCLVCRSLF